MTEASLERGLASPQPASAGWKASGPWLRQHLSLSGLHLVLVLLAFTMVLPFVWMVLTSLKPLGEVGVENWLPTQVMWSNYREVFSVIPFARFYGNSIFIAAWVTFLQVFTSSLAAFSFARLQWPGRDKVFLPIPAAAAATPEATPNDSDSTADSTQP